MSRVRIDAIKPGNTLAEDVINADGRFLLGKGTMLDPAHLRVLKIWGITSVEIQQPDLEAVFLHLTGRALRD